MAPELQLTLLKEALEDPDAGTDCHGFPRKLWNALGGVVFVGVSANCNPPEYNCYPEVPLTALRSVLLERAERSVDTFTPAKAD